MKIIDNRSFIIIINIINIIIIYDCSVISSYHHIDCDKYDHHLSVDDNYVIL